MFNFVKDSHNANTRSSINNELHLPKPNTEIFKSSLHYRGSQFWNKLPMLVKTFSSLNSLYLSFGTCWEVSVPIKSINTK